MQQYDRVKRKMNVSIAMNEKNIYTHCQFVLLLIEVKIDATDIVQIAMDIFYHFTTNIFYAFFKYISLENKETNFSDTKLFYS